MSPPLSGRQTPFLRVSERRRKRTYPVRIRRYDGNRERTCVLSPPNRKCAKRAVTPTAGADNAERLGHEPQYLGSGNPRPRDAAAEAGRGPSSTTDRDCPPTCQSDARSRNPI